MHASHRLPIMTGLRIAALIGALLLAAAPGEVSAQWLNAEGTSDERIVLVGLSEDLEMPDLAKAFAMLRRSRLKHGAIVDRELRAPITMATAAPRDGRAVAAAARLLRALDGVEPTMVDGLGTLPVVPAVTVLPEPGR